MQESSIFLCMYVCMYVYSFVGLLRLNFVMQSHLFSILSTYKTLLYNFIAFDIFAIVKIFDTKKCQRLVTLPNNLGKIKRMSLNFDNF